LASRVVEECHPSSRVNRYANEQNIAKQMTVSHHGLNGIGNKKMSSHQRHDRPFRKGSIEKNHNVRAHPVPLPGKSGGLNGWTQHFLEVYSQESENLKSLAGVDLSAAPLCSDPTGNSRTGRFSSGSTVIRVRLCFRSSRVARDSADHRSRLSHPWPP
jgi:hypothetical protein